MTEMVKKAHPLRKLGGSVLKIIGFGTVAGWILDSYYRNHKEEVDAGIEKAAQKAGTWLGEKIFGEHKEPLNAMEFKYETYLLSEIDPEDIVYDAEIYAKVQDNFIHVDDPSKWTEFTLFQKI